MPCPRCQQHNPADAIFCQECGSPLEATCPSCGTQNQLGAKFCKRCGQRLGQGEAAQAAPGPRFGAPESYIPKHLAEKILTSRSALEGERKQVTVLFADLKGSMELLADRDPEEARKLLDPVLERMMEAVHRYEGTVNQVMGDGIMALFGAPVAHEDHAVRACYAALDMQAAIRRYAEEVRRLHGIALQVRLGLNSGEVVVRSIGSDLHMDYTAVGQTTHLAARMEQLASPGTTLLTADTLRLAEGSVEVTPGGAVPVKGLGAPVETYVLAGAGPGRSRLVTAASRGLTTFVGREVELEQLRQALGRAAAGHGQVVALVGEAGVGKSRLVWEVTHSHRTHGWLIAQTGAVSYGRAVPYLPVIDLLKRYFGIQDQDDQRTMRDRIIGRLFGLDRALEPTLPAFLALLDVPVDDPQWPTLDPPQRRQRTIDGIKRLLLRESHVQPVFVVVEDLHWIDRETQTVLDALVESLPAARLFFLVNYRPEYAHHWGSKTYYTQLRLDPLPPASADELLAALLGPDDSVQGLKPALIARTQGNPFFLEESVRTLAESHVLVGARGAYRLGKRLDEIRVPATVQAVLAARIDRLPPEDKQLLQAASVIGHEVPVALLQPIADHPEDVLRRGLAHLQATELLYETSLFPEPEYAFKHALTHEVAYGGLLGERRRELHARIVDAIERVYAGRLVEHAERLAHHALRGERWGQAVTYLEQSGAKAATRGAYREAVEWLEHALGALQRMPRSRAVIQREIDIRFDLRSAWLPLGEIQRILDTLREAEALATGLADRQRLGWVSTYMAIYFLNAGDNEGASKAGERALAIAASLDDLGLRVVASSYTSWVSIVLGEYRQALALAGVAVEALTGELIRERFRQAVLPSVFSRGLMVQALAEHGDFTEGISIGEDTVRIAEELNQPFSRVAAYLFLGELYARRGDGERAVALLEAGLHLVRTWGFSIWFPLNAAELGLAYARSGRVTDALPLLEQATEQASAMGQSVRRALHLAWLAEAYLLAGRPEDALEPVEEALRLSREHNERGHHAWALWVRGNITALRDRSAVGQAGRDYEQALAQATTLGMRPLVAHCHLGLGSLYARTADRQKAHDHLTTAATMYREMDMRFWLERVEAELEPPRKNAPGAGPSQPDCQSDLA